MSFASFCSKRALLAFVVLSFVFTLPSNRLLGQVFSYEDAPLVTVIDDIEQSTPYRFLYRDALVSGIKLSFAADSDSLLDRLAAELVAFGLGLQIDHERRMVFVSREMQTKDARLFVRGTISDARSLDRLPYATVLWEGARGLRGLAADDAGRFSIELDSFRQSVLLVASHIGYRADTLVLDPQNAPRDLSIKLVPRTVVGSEVVVSSPLLSSSLDSTWFYLLSAPLGTPVGEQSVTRSLQALPAVGLTTAVSSGLNVRGSRIDGFQILLDGMPIYSHSHLFGMFDAFNPDALQAVGFYYGIAPARFQAPPGGTLSFLTRTGSKRRFSGRLGLTNASGSATAEGPAGGGRASWIVSARRSYLDNVDWFKNDQLMAIGLGVGRETSGTRRIPLDERTLVSEPPSANFFDVHANFDYESRSGATFQITAYAGGDNTAQDGHRIVALAPQRADPFVRSPITTTNQWSNIALSAHYRGAVQHWGFTHTYAGISRHESDFRKDDFFYRAPRQGNVDSQLLFAPFLNQNSLTELRLAHEASVGLSPTLDASAGFSAQRLVSLYKELSALRREFESDRRAWQIDLFGEVSKRTSAVSMTVGLRPHYFTFGRHFRLSPRVTLAAFPGSPVSFSAGYTRNYQFIHHLYIENEAGSNIWVLTTENEAPGAVDHLTASFLHRSARLTAQLDGFLKWHRNLRRHETILRPGGIPDGPVLFSPWTHNNAARAQGREALLAARLHPATVTMTYTLSRVQIRHPDVNNGRYFFADWDRPHQLALHGQLSLSNALSGTISLNIASGQPNPLAFVDSSERRRYSTYRRVDLVLQYRARFTKATLDTFFRVYNLLDTRNTWYRTVETVLVGRGQNIRLAFEPVDVYDLGAQPSFGLSLSL